MKPWYKKWWGILLILVLFSLLCLIFALAFYIINFDYQAQSAQNAIAIKDLPAEVTGTDKNYWLGSAKPQLLIVEFGDFACPYCHKSFPKIREISSTHKDKVKIIWRDYPVISEFSQKLSLAARCAGEQGLFWVMHDKLFANQGADTDQEVLELFGQTGGNEAKFSACYSNGKYLPDIEKDLLDGKKLGITGTPTWFFNGQRVEGDVPYEYIVNLVNNSVK